MKKSKLKTLVFASALLATGGIAAGVVTACSAPSNSNNSADQNNPITESQKQQDLEYIKVYHATDAELVSIGTDAKVTLASTAAGINGVNLVNYIKLPAISHNFTWDTKNSGNNFVAHDETGTIDLTIYADDKIGVIEPVVLTYTGFEPKVHNAARLYLESYAPEPITANDNAKNVLADSVTATNYTEYFALPVIAGGFSWLTSNIQFVSNNNEGTLSVTVTAQHDTITSLSKDFRITVSGFLLEPVKQAQDAINGYEPEFKLTADAKQTLPSDVNKTNYTTYIKSNNLPDGFEWLTDSVVLTPTDTTGALSISLSAKNSTVNISKDFTFDFPVGSFENKQQHDDRQLIAKYLSEFKSAKLNDIPIQKEYLPSSLLHDGIGGLIGTNWLGGNFKVAKQFEWQAPTTAGATADDSLGEITFNAILRSKTQGVLPVTFRLTATGLPTTTDFSEKI